MKLIKIKVYLTDYKGVFKPLMECYINPDHITQVDERVDGCYTIYMNYCNGAIEGGESEQANYHVKELPLAVEEAIEAGAE